MPASTRQENQNFERKKSRQFLGKVINLTRWIFLGDESRRQFVRWILRDAPEMPDEEKSLTIRRGQKPFEKSVKDNQILISTYYLPPGIEIFVPAYSDDMNINTEAFDKCAIFEMFPFGKESTEDLARLLESSKKSSPMLLFVLTDTVCDEEADSLVGLQSYKKFLLKKERDVLVARDESDVAEILHWHRPLAADLIKQIRRELGDINRNFDEFFDAYDRFLAEQKIGGCLSEPIKNKIVSFSTIKGKSHIWMNYRDAAGKILFPANSGGLNGAIEIYCDALFRTAEENTLASFIWDVSEDKARLFEKLKNAFTEGMQTPKKFRGFLNPDEYNSEHIYKSLVRRGGRFSGISEEFLEEYEKFVSRTAREIVTSELEVHTRKLKEMIQ